MKVIIEKHEWHQVDSQYTFEMTEEVLSEIYPDLDVGEIASLLVRMRQVPFHCLTRSCNGPWMVCDSGSLLRFVRSDCR